MVNSADHSAERHEATRPLSDIFEDIQALAPRVVDAFKPSDGDAQRKQFLTGEISNPVHNYPGAEALDFAAIDEQLQGLRREIEAQRGMRNEFMQMYVEVIEGYRKMYAMIEHSVTLRQPRIDDGARDHARAEYARLNAEIYGEPDPREYMAHVMQLRGELDKKELPPELQKVRDELFAQLPTAADGETYERYRPSPETVEKMQLVTKTLFGNMVRHVPAREERFMPQEIGSIFETIIAAEFGEAAEGWTVEVADATSVNVNPFKKKVTVPKDRVPATLEEVQGLVVHELGTHFLRAVMGDETDLPIMALGLPRYADFEEGAATAADEAFKGKYNADPSLLYIAAGLAAGGADFRTVHEAMWRIRLLQDGNAAADLDAATAKAKRNAYLTTRRIFRGTDELPLYKDLSYARGKQQAWQYFEQCFGDNGEVDDMAILLAFIGKTDAANPAHRRTSLETHTPHAATEGDEWTLQS